MSLWVDKYRPTSLDKLEIHEDQTTIFKQLSQEESDFPHLLIYGPSGAGKKTRTGAILRELYGSGAEKV
jgi:replication factor C subunit 3/5